LSADETSKLVIKKKKSHHTSKSEGYSYTAVVVSHTALCLTTAENTMATKN